MEIHISDGQQTESIDNEAERPAIQLAREYAARYDLNGVSGWVVCRCWSDDDQSDAVDFAFDSDGNFEWGTDREYTL